MWFLFFEIWLWLLLAFAAGWISHWFLCCRDKEKKPKQDTAQLIATAISEAEARVGDGGAQMEERWKPLGFTSQPEQIDDLKKIKGIGEKIESTLNELGYFQYSQIAEWTEQNVEWVETFLSFPGRIEREDWLNQARKLAQGESTEFSSRVDSGDVDY